MKEKGLRFKESCRQEHQFSVNNGHIQCITSLQLTYRYIKRVYGLLFLLIYHGLEGSKQRQEITLSSEASLKYLYKRGISFLNCRSKDEGGLKMV